MSNFSYTPPLFGHDDSLDHSLDISIKGKKVICTFQISVTQLELLKNVSDYQNVTVSALIRSALDHFIFKGIK